MVGAPWTHGRGEVAKEVAVWGAVKEKGVPWAKEKVERPGVDGSASSGSEGGLIPFVSGQEAVV